MCPNPLRYLKHVKLSKHACKRFWDYTDDIQKVGKENWTVRRIKLLVAKRLAIEFRKGLFIDGTGAIHVPIAFGLYAAIVFTPKGYLVVTFHKNEKDIDIDDLREQYL